MNIRHATADDFDLRALWEQWQAESPKPPPWADTSWDANRPEFEQALDANALFLAEADGQPVGFVTAWLEDHFARIGDLYVREGGRRRNRSRPRRDRDRAPARPRRDAPLPERDRPGSRGTSSARAARPQGGRRSDVDRAMGGSAPDSFTSISSMTWRATSRKPSFAVLERLQIRVQEEMRRAAGPQVLDHRLDERIALPAAAALRT